MEIDIQSTLQFRILVNVTDSKVSLLIIFLHSISYRSDRITIVLLIFIQIIMKSNDSNTMVLIDQ